MFPLDTICNHFWLPDLNKAALFYRTQDPHRTQDSGRRTTGPAPDFNMLIFEGELPSAAYCHHCQIGIFSFFTGARAQVYKSNSLSSIQLCGELRVEAVMDTDIDVSTGPRPLLILFICFCEPNIFALKYFSNCHVLVAIFKEYLRQRWDHLFISELFVTSKVQSCPVKAVKIDT